MQKLINLLEYKKAPLVLSWALFLSVLINAWVSDDAYISFRTVDNFVNGYGLTFNTDERVQTFTNPLLVLILIPIHFLFHSISVDVIYFESIGLSLLFLGIFLSILHKFKMSRFRKSILLVMLILNVSFIDFFTSGLENSLNFVLVILLVRCLDSKKYAFVAIISGLLVLSRLDLFVLVLPIVVYLIEVIKGIKKQLRTLLLFVGPWFIWLAFVMVYYGVLLPNSVVAKSAFSPTFSSIIENDFNYLLGTTFFHPLAFIMPFVLIILLGKTEKVNLYLIAGAILYLLIPFTAGGDFMAGRFQTIPTLMLVLVLVRSEFHIEKTKIYLTLFAVIFLVHPNGYLFQPYNLLHPKEFKYGVAEEKLCYFPRTSLLVLAYQGFGFSHKTFENPLKLRFETEERKASIFLACGMFGYYAGPKVHVVDRIGIVNPLLARLPLRENEYWRPGHPIKRIPKNYLGTINTRHNHLQDPELRALYNDIDLVVRSKEFFSGERWAAIWRLNTGFHKIDRDYE